MQKGRNMTKLQEILVQLEKSPGGMTSAQLREHVDIQPNVLATLLWEMKRDKLISQVGGVRGRYVYAITQKGRSHLPDNEKDPLTRLANALEREEAGGKESFQELLTVIEQLEEFRLLRRFTQWLVTESHHLLHPKKSPSALRDGLMVEALKFLGVNPESYEEQRESLSELLHLV